MYPSLGAITILGSFENLFETGNLYIALWKTNVWLKKKLKKIELQGKKYEKNTREFLCLSA